MIHHPLGVLALLGAIIYGAKTKTGLHWAYGLTIIGAIVYCVAGVLAWCAASGEE